MARNVTTGREDPQLWLAVARAAAEVAAVDLMAVVPGGAFGGRKAAGALTRWAPWLVADTAPVSFPRRARFRTA